MHFIPIWMQVQHIANTDWKQIDGSQIDGSHYNVWVFSGFGSDKSSLHVKYDVRCKSN